PSYLRHGSPQTTVYLHICHVPTLDCNYVVKATHRRTFVPTEEQPVDPLYRECLLNRLAASCHVAPNLVDAWICPATEAKQDIHFKMPASWLDQRKGFETVYMVMETAPGKTVCEWLLGPGMAGTTDYAKHKLRVTSDQMEGMILSIQEAVQKLHACGIVHRD